MFQNMPLWPRLALSFALAFVVAYLMTPHVKTFAERIGAIDIPKDERRIHDHPIPRMGGLAIFMGFIASVIIFVSFSSQVMGILLGALIIAAMGAVDDIVSLRPWIKLVVQVIAALVAIRCGLYFSVITNPNILSYNVTINMGWLAFPLTVFWIVGCTNAFNLIDGLDGLAVGVSAISSFTLLVVSILVSDANTCFVLAALCGACVGFMPYNMNPARIFMGDVGSQFLGFVLATVSIMGFFKLSALITVVVPMMAMLLPLADTTFAFTRRILHGQSPFHADRGHFHHRLLAMGLTQKQAVAVLYAFSAVMGLVSVIIAGRDREPIIRVCCVVAIILVVICTWMIIVRKYPHFVASSVQAHNAAAEAELAADKEKMAEALRQEQELSLAPDETLNLKLESDMSTGIKLKAQAAEKILELTLPHDQTATLTLEKDEPEGMKLKVSRNIKEK